jgi:hypothetical protein
MCRVSLLARPTNSTARACPAESQTRLRARAVLMRHWRLRWARPATALCLAIVFLLYLQLAVHIVDARMSMSPSSRRAHGHARHRSDGLPPPSTPASRPVHRAVATGRGGALAVSFDAAEARCKSRELEANGADGAGQAAAPPCADDDDKRRIPTGANPLHNR